MDVVTYELWPGHWEAYDRETYDGAPDSSTRHQIGHGTTLAEAVEDLMEQLFGELK